MSRTKYSIINSVINILCNFLIMLIGLIAQVIFIKILGVEYLGINGLFSNILSMLGIFELGIGNAIAFNLYNPIAKKDTETIKSLMQFYHKAYITIAIVMMVVGCCLIPFLGVFVGETTVDVNLKIVYFLFLLQMVSAYAFSYKFCLLTAVQKGYIIKISHLLFNFSFNVLQLLILIFYKNYYMYLIIKIICQLICNILTTIYINKNYPFLMEKNIKKLEKKYINDIFSRIKAFFFHKVGGFIINGTDNIIISKFFGVTTVGVYSNYYMITNAVTTLFSQLILSATASVGNLLVSDNQKKFEVFKKMRFLNAWISIFTATCILLIIEPFISVWVGKEYILGKIVLIVIVINFFQKMQRSTYTTFQDSAGIWIENRFVPIVESIFNIVFSILCLKIFGLSGVFMGTIISGLTLWCYSYPRFVYKKLFNRSYFDYTKETVGYIFLFFLIAIISYAISSFVVVDNLLVQVIINIIICVVVPNSILLILFRKTDNFKYFEDILLSIKNKIFTRHKNK